VTSSAAAATAQSWSGSRCQRRRRRRRSDSWRRTASSLGTGVVVLGYMLVQQAWQAQLLSLVVGLVAVIGIPARMALRASVLTPGATQGLDRFHRGGRATRPCARSAGRVGRHSDDQRASGLRSGVPPRAGGDRVVASARTPCRQPGHAPRRHPGRLPQGLAVDEVQSRGLGIQPDRVHLLGRHGPFLVCRSIVRGALGRSIEQV